MTVSVLKPAHIVAVPFEAWGHVRPLLHFTIQLLALHPNLHITHLLSPSVAPRVKAELASTNFAHVHESNTSTNILPRIQLIEVHVASESKTTGQSNGGGAEASEKEPEKGELTRDMQARADAYAEAIKDYFSVLFGVSSGEGDAAKLDNKFKSILPICVIGDVSLSLHPNEPLQPHDSKTKVHADQFPVDVSSVRTNGRISSKIRGGNEDSVPVFYFMPCGPNSIIHHYAKDGFVAGLLRRVNEGVQQGEDPLEVIAPLGAGDSGRRKSLPGLPIMTDYELHPGIGACPFPPPFMIQLLRSYETAWSPHLTGFIGPNVLEMEQMANGWFEANMGKPYLSLGLQYSDNVWKGDIAPPKEGDSDGLKAMDFLDRMLKRRGPKSVIYVSFGSAFFPIERPDLVHHLLDTLLSTSTPFLFAHATELFPVPEDLLHKIQDAPFGLAIKVAPQVQVLHHPATGYFVSHCGGNSMAEAIVAGVPVVGMPFAADQGEHIMILKKFKAGIDLKQVKCFVGEGEKPKVLYDGTKLVGTADAIRDEMVDLWAQLKGELGQELYEGMGKLHRLCQKSCAEGGASRQAMLDFAKYF